MTNLCNKCDSFEIKKLEKELSKNNSTKKYSCIKSKLGLRYNLDLKDCSIAYFRNGRPSSIEIFHSRKGNEGILTTLSNEDKDFDKLSSLLDNYLSN